MIELLRKRRSIRKYQSREINEESIAILKEALLRSPSSKNIKPWQFIFIKNRELLTRLALAKSSGGTFLKDAPLAVVICANEQESDVWIEDCTIAAITLQYSAASLGLGTCWCQIRNRAHKPELSAEAYCQELLKLPEHKRVVAIIAIGYPAESKESIPRGLLDYYKIEDNGG